MSSHILVPGEITVQMGSDFDVDKLFLMMPNIIGKDGEQGAYKASMLNKITPENIDTYLQEFVANDKTTTSTKIKKLQNLIIDITTSIMTSPHHYLETISPLDAEVYNKKNPDSIISKIVKESSSEKTEAVNREIKRLQDLPQDARVERELSILKYDKTLADENKLGRNDIGTEVSLYNTNKSAAKGIAMWASSLSANWVIGNLNNTNKELKVPESYAIKVIDKAGVDYTLDTLSVMRAIDSSTKTSQFSANVSIAVDNNKDPNAHYDEWIINLALDAMNEVFEATKEECADKAETVLDCIGNYTHVIDKESILTIQKPNLYL
jgi:hypothetical protein